MAEGKDQGRGKEEATMKGCLLIAPRTAWNIKEVYELFLQKKVRTGHKGHMSIEEMQFLDPDNLIW